MFFVVWFWNCWSTWLCERKIAWSLFIIRVYCPKFWLWHASLVVDATVSARIKVFKTLYGSFHVHHLLERGLLFGPCKVIQENLGFWIPRCGFQIPCPRIPDSTSVDSGFHGPKVGGFQLLVSNVSSKRNDFFAPKIFPCSDFFPNVCCI